MYRIPMYSIAFKEVLCKSNPRKVDVSLDIYLISFTPHLFTTSTNLSYNGFHANKGRPIESHDPSRLIMLVMRSHWTNQTNKRGCAFSHLFEMGGIRHNQRI